MKYIDEIRVACMLDEMGLRKFIKEVIEIDIKRNKDGI